MFDESDEGLRKTCEEIQKRYELKFLEIGTDKVIRPKVFAVKSASKIDPLIGKNSVENCPPI